MKRLLCILSNMNAGGAETFLMKLYRGIDKTKYQMDFCINSYEHCFYEDEILSMGGNIYRIPSKSENFRKFKKQLAEIVRSNHYKHVLRITSSAMGFWDLKIAHKAGAEICVARSSNSSDGGSLKSKIAHLLGKMLYSKYVNVMIAPSDLAAKYTFGEKVYKNGAVNILHNAIDLSVFHYNMDAGSAVRNEFNIPVDTTIIGHIGRFNQQKNHDFLLNIFKAYAEKNPHSVLMLVGKGELEENVRAKAQALSISDKVIFTGVRSDVPALLSAMDVFVFPSFYEGMPNTVIEAQATGLPCVIADTITREASITGLVHYLPLGDANLWVEHIDGLPSSIRETPIQKFKDNCYDIETVTEQFVKLIFKE